jgi:3-dehydroquinate synthetase
MVAAARLSASLGSSGPDVADRIKSLLGGLGLVTELPEDLDREAVISAVSYDKKSSGGKVIFILTEAIGHCVQREIDRGSIGVAL